MEVQEKEYDDKVKVNLCDLCLQFCFIDSPYIA